MTPKQLEAIADRIARYAEQMGFRVSRGYSGSSGSCYVIAEIGADETYRSAKVRVSDHTLPPSYSPSDIDVEPMGLAWHEAVERLAEIAGAPLPAPVKAHVTRLAKAAAKRTADEARRSAEAAAYREAHAPLDTLRDAIMAERGWDRLTGNKRRKAKQKATKLAEARL